MIEIINMKKHIGKKVVLNDINLKVEKGSIFGLIGPNGAGKTTLIKSITGIYKADSGEIKINGQQVFENNNVKKVMGYVADDNNHLNFFKIKEMIKFYSLTYDSFSIKRFNKLNELFKIPLDTNIIRLSKGMKTRLSTMLAFSIMPEILILDEPTSGLDPLVKKQVLNLLVEDAAERGTTIFISSHNLSDLERICDTIAIIDNGEIKYTNSIENMKKSIKKLQVVFKGDAPSEIEDWDEVISVTKMGRVYNIVTKEYNDNFLHKLRGFDLALEEEIDLSLEDMFVHVVGGDEFYEEVYK